MFKFGDSLLLYGVVLWVSIVVGPWWVGVGLVILSLAGNSYHDNLLLKQKQEIIKELTKNIESILPEQTGE